MMTLLESILLHEGFNAKPYKDTKGILTFGHGLTYITEDESICIVINRLRERGKQLEPYISKLSINKQEVLIEMSFQLGINGLMNFKRMWKAIKREDWFSARNEMLDSQWAKHDSPGRALEMADKFLLG